MKRSSRSFFEREGGVYEKEAATLFLPWGIPRLYDPIGKGSSKKGVRWGEKTFLFWRGGKILWGEKKGNTPQ